MPRVARTYSSPTSQILKLVGKRIKLSRKTAGMSEANLAERVGIARSTLQRIEAGDPSVEIGIVLEAALISGTRLFDPDVTRLLTETEMLERRLAPAPRVYSSHKRQIDDDF
ncbi:helix-turn-helix transcriptional regulator [Nisaea sediminum]|uniref:helix-turn-helix transcriptional regulator n=1 Tax=Nisaea sediminum TaxID=2775867 RepID=UPI001866D440|nr:helix-turn-helix transcriptional regulator [Nisaea sediminum]